MKFNFSIFLFLFVCCISCTQKKEQPATILEKTFLCESTIKIASGIRQTDIKNNFSIEIPSTWKSSSFFDEYQSDIYAADTTKILTDTYIIDTSWNAGELKLNQDFVKSVVSKSDLLLLFSEFENFKDKPAYWHLSKGIKNGLDYQILNLYIQTKYDSYILVTTEIYGNNAIEQRLCDAINIINTIEFI